MLPQLLVAGLLLQTATNPTAATPPVKTVVAKEVDSGDPVALLKLRRIFVESFGEDAVSREAQSMITSALVETKRFKVTENRERADAILKGVAIEKNSQELHAYSEGTAVGHGAISDSSAHTQTVNEAKLSIRLIDPDGDVIWTSTQESKGAKYKGASADVADRCVKQLLRDVEKLEGSHPEPSKVVSSPNADTK